MKKIFTLFLLFAVAFSGVAQEEYSDLLNLLVPRFLLASPRGHSLLLPGCYWCLKYLTSYLSTNATRELYQFINADVSNEIVR